ATACGGSRAESPTDGVPGARHDDGDAGGRLLGRGDDRVTDRHDDIDRQADQLSEEHRSPVELPVSGAEFDDDVLALYVTEFAQPVACGLPQVAFQVATVEKCHAGDPLAGLRPSGERRGEEATSERAAQDPPVHL